MEKTTRTRLVNHAFPKCIYCNNYIELHQKSIRDKNKWFHAECLKARSRSDLKTAATQQKATTHTELKKPVVVYRTQTISEETYVPKSQKTPSDEKIERPAKPAPEPKPISEKPNTVPQKNQKTIRAPVTKKPRLDPVLVLLAVAIFSVLVFTAYNIMSMLSLAAIGAASIIVFYHLLSRKPPQTQYRYKTKGASFYSICVLAMPFVFGTLMAFDGRMTFMTLTQAIFVWSLALSFWQTMLFVPLAIRSVTREALLPEPAEYPRITVIVPAYNEEKVIRTTIESLLATDYPDKEIIVVDDGSTDKTLEIAKQYSDRIKVIHKENGGKASALNQGLLYATGDIVTIVDADTIIGHSSLKHIAKGMMDENVVAVAGNIKIRNKVNWLTWCQALEYLSGIQIMRRGLDYFGAITIVPGALGAFRKKKLEEAGTYHKETLVEDFDATMKVLRSGMIVNGSNAATAYTQAPQTLRDYYKQRKRWYRGNLQVLKRHSDILLNPRFGYLQRLSYPLMAIHMLVIPIASLMLWGFAAYQILIGNYYFVAFTLGMFIVMQYLLSAMAVRMDNDDKKMILYSIFLVIGYKQIIDVLQLKAVVEEILGTKAKWTSAQRVRQ
ncbi:MAG TPA: glycosyltransferase [Candidatus Nitrosotenuis sp.]|nr:glycosyltransferase [Candidatus Nitrosotenuis sp.]